MIVVDIGCQQQDHEESVVKLCKAYRPDILYGFDPHPNLVPGIERYEHPKARTRARSSRPRAKHRGSVPAALSGPAETVIVRSRLAAWTNNGFVSYREAGICSGVVPEGDSAAAVPCFDLVAWLKTLPMPDEEVVLKVDAEGSEFPLMWAIYDNALDLLLKEVLIEYHPASTANGWWRDDRPSLRCPVQDWDLHW